jgi:hypothetical protein
VTVHTGTNPVTLARLAADVKQLADPIHTAVRGKIVTHAPLLDQLRASAVPGGGTRGPERRRVPDSRPPARLDVVDALAEVYVGISGWHAKLSLPSPPRDVDWQKAVLRSLVGAASGLAPSIAEWLAADVQGWWHDAAVGSGWRPADLLKLR